MNITLCDDKVFPFLIIDNFYNNEEEIKIWIDLELLHPLLKDEKTSTGNMAVDGDGNKKGDAKRVYLDTFFGNNRGQSNILTYYKKIVSPEIIKTYTKNVPAGITFQSSDTDISQISYYDESGYYGEHHDLYMHTCLIWFYKEPKKFQGGDLKFIQSKTTVDCKHNRMVLFPSYYLHEVVRMDMNKEYINKGFGRYCLTHFYNINGYKNNGTLRNNK